MLTIIFLPGWGNAELQYYTSDNFKVDSGGLRLTATNEGAKYYSSKVHTKGKREFCPSQSTNGIRVEANLELPEGGQAITKTICKVHDDNDCW